MYTSVSIVNHCASFPAQLVSVTSHTLPPSQHKQGQPRVGLVSLSSRMGPAILRSCAASRWPLTQHARPCLNFTANIVTEGERVQHAAMHLPHMFRWVVWGWRLERSVAQSGQTERNPRDLYCSQFRAQLVQTKSKRPQPIYTDVVFKNSIVIFLFRGLTCLKCLEN